MKCFVQKVDKRNEKSLFWAVISGELDIPKIKEFDDITNGHMMSILHVFISALYRGRNKSLYAVARSFLLALLNPSAWICLGPS